ncbi:hypothetical protein CASFOL_029824 [Castilleja foliolosa]|uniref:NAC domain-containing protein n=1 Tax=Castilleja foliolosa TaxID=1961234 RepID=A0ABD3CBU6_9LAMI
MEPIKFEALPKGYRFRPTDEELISHYLRLKINGHHSEVDVTPEVDVCKWEPWYLPGVSPITSAEVRETTTKIERICMDNGKRWFPARRGIGPHVFDGALKKIANF